MKKKSKKRELKDKQEESSKYLTMALSSLSSSFLASTPMDLSFHQQPTSPWRCCTKLGLYFININLLLFFLFSSSIKHFKLFAFLSSDFTLLLSSSTSSTSSSPSCLSSSSSSCSFFSSNQLFIEADLHCIYNKVFGNGIVGAPTSEKNEIAQKNHGKFWNYPKK